MSRKNKIITFLFVLAVIIAICILSNSITIDDNFLAHCSAGFLCLCVFAFLLIQGQDKSDKDYEIAQLKQEIRKLEEIQKSDEHIIELFKQENEMLKDRIAFYETNE